MGQDEGRWDSGEITQIDICGTGGLASAQLEIRIDGTSGAATYAVYPDIAPQVFSAMASLITAAYFNKRTLYLRVKKHPSGAVDMIHEVSLVPKVQPSPRGKKKRKKKPAGV